MEGLTPDMERRFTNKNWRTVLREVVDYAPNNYGRGKTGYGDDHPLARASNLNISGYELTMIMSFLEEQGLIVYDQSQHNWIHVTSKGFDVALQNQSADKANKRDRATLILSLVLALAVVFAFLVGIENPIERSAMAAILGIAVVGGVYLVTKHF